MQNFDKRLLFCPVLAKIIMFYRYVIIIAKFRRVRYPPEKSYVEFFQFVFFPTRFLTIVPEQMRRVYLVNAS